MQPVDTVRALMKMWGKKQGQWIKLIRFFTFLESLHRADYTEVFFDIFVVYVQKEKEKKGGEKQQLGF